MLFRLAAIFAYLLGHAEAQKHPNSPVFKDYKPPGPTSIIEQSEATYQMWQGLVLMQKANAGDVLAQHELGIRYLAGRGFRPDTVKGAYWIQKAAERNLMPARFNMGILQFNGWGVPWNPFSAYRNFLYCAQLDMPEAQYILGLFLTDGLVVERDWRSAYQWVKKAAEGGYRPAQEVLPEFEKRGYSLDIESETTTERNDEGRLAGNTIGLVFLDFGEDTTAAVDDVTLLRDALREGGASLRGVLGPNADTIGRISIDSLGLEVLRRAAEGGSPEALAILGRCYETGILVSQDMVAATVHYLRAVRYDSPRAYFLLWRLIRQHGYFDHLKMRVSTGDNDALYSWVGLVAVGVDRQLTEKQALEMIVRAANRDHVYSLVELGLCYYSGRWVRKDLEQAKEIWRRAATQGSQEAKERLAIATVLANKHSAEVSHAVALLEQSAKAGSILSRVALGYCYETGTGVPVDKGKAAQVYRGEAQRGSQDAYRALRRMHDRIRPPDHEFQLME